MSTPWKLRKLLSVFHHPLTAEAPWSAINRLLKWHIASHILGLSIIVPYVNDTKVVVRADMQLPSLIYFGLHEFEDMSFVLHFLSDADLFCDVGANIGVYSILASGVRGARSVAMEPVPATAEALRLNIAINGLSSLVDALEIGAGADRGELDFSTDRAGGNHVVQYGNGGCRVPVFPLDDVFATETPLLMKIDVEGFETNVIRGSKRLLNDATLKVVLMEMNGCGRRYGFDERALDSEVRGYGFNSFRYDPHSRELSLSNPQYILNTLYVRDHTFVEHRLKEAKSFQVRGHQI